MNPRQPRITITLPEPPPTPHEPRYHWTTLQRALGCDTPTAAADLLGIGHTEMRHMLERGLTEKQADRYATRAGMHPATVWGRLWWCDGQDCPDEMAA